MIRLHAKVQGSTEATHHLLASPASEEIDITQLPDSISVGIIEQDAAFFRLRPDDRGQCVADTWHATLEAAKTRAAFEFEIAADAGAP